MNKEIFLHAKDWIITNQKNDGAICWDEKGKFDAWDHSECLLALAIFEEWNHSVSYTHLTLPTTPYV